MDSESWRRLEQAFFDALELPAEQRAAFLDAACQGDAAFRAELDTVEAVDSVCTDVQHKRGDVLDMLVREALIARGKLSSQG